MILRSLLLLSSLVESLVMTAGSRRKMVGDFSLAPPMTLEKYKKMQQKRVRLLVIYSGGERHFTKTYLGVKELVSKTFPDVLVEKKIRPVRSNKDTGKFDIFVDDKLIWSKPPERPGVFLSMRTLNAAVIRARRLRRPGQIVYGDRESRDASCYAGPRERQRENPGPP